MVFKRKQTTTETVSTRSVVYSPSPNSNNNYNWKATLSFLNRPDPVLDQLTALSSQPQTASRTVETKLEQLQHQQDALEQECNQCLNQQSQEEMEVSRLKLQLEQAQQEGQQLQQSHQMLLSTVDQLNRERSGFVVATSKGSFNNNNNNDKHYQTLQHRAPRLQSQLSLYANMTGIKWGYDQEEGSSSSRRVLAGEVLTDTKQIVPFRLDVSECSDYEVSHRLWQLIEGGSLVDDEN